MTWLCEGQQQITISDQTYFRHQNVNTNYVTLPGFKLIPCVLTGPGMDNILSTLGTHTYLRALLLVGGGGECGL
jgi:hypothetical protein